MVDDEAHDEATAHIGSPLPELLGRVARNFAIEERYATPAIVVCGSRFARSSPLGAISSALSELLQSTGHESAGARTARVEGLLRGTAEWMAGRDGLLPAGRLLNATLGTTFPEGAPLEDADSIATASHAPGAASTRPARCAA